MLHITNTTNVSEF